MTTEFRQPTNIDNRRGAIRTSSKKISHRMETKKCFSSYYESTESLIKLEFN